MLEECDLKRRAFSYNDEEALAIVGKTFLCMSERGGVEKMDISAAIDVIDAKISEVETHVKEIQDDLTSIEKKHLAKREANRETLSLIDWMLGRKNLTDAQREDLLAARNVFVNAAKENFSMWKGGNNTGLPEERNGKVIVIKDEYDAVNVSNILCSMRIMDKINSLRAEDDNFIGRMKRNDSYTNFYYMAEAAVGAMRAAGLRRPLPANGECESVAFVYYTPVCPTDEWYTEEKKQFDRIKAELGIKEISEETDVKKIEEEAYRQGVIVGDYTNLFWAADQVMGVGFTMYHCTCYYNASAVHQCRNMPRRGQNYLYTVEEFSSIVWRYVVDEQTEVECYDYDIEEAKNELYVTNSYLKELKARRAAYTNKRAE